MGTYHGRAGFDAFSHYRTVWSVRTCRSASPGGRAPFRKTMKMYAGFSFGWHLNRLTPTSRVSQSELTAHVSSGNGRSILLGDFFNSPYETYRRMQDGHRCTTARSTSFALTRHEDVAAAFKDLRPTRRHTEWIWVRYAKAR